MDESQYGDHRVCSECVDEPFLRSQMEANGLRADCSYCELEGCTYSINQLADCISGIFTDVYHRTYEDPKGRTVVEVIKSLTGLGEAACGDVRCVLNERTINEFREWFEDDSFNASSRYVRSVDGWEFDAQWRRSKRSLETEARYFNREAEQILAAIFDGVDDWRTVTRRPIVRDAGPGTDFAKLYRARVFQSKADLVNAMKRPDTEIGPPLGPKATAGRMNAAGISVFYGATDPHVARAEVRPPVGSKVLVGCFEVIRPLKLLDPIAIDELADETGSLFDEEYRRSLKRAQFLRGLGKLLSKPVLPNDEAREYLSTQAVADFLATAAKPPLDGIVYPSVQDGHEGRLRPLFRGGRYPCNVVLFHKAARVEPLDAGSVISVSNPFAPYRAMAPAISGLPDADDEFLDDSPEAKYEVWVRDQPPGVPEPLSDRFAIQDDDEDATLRFSSLEVHYVRRVRFDTVSSPIPRHHTKASEAAEPGQEE
jgi:hypothetical protein